MSFFLVSNKTSLADLITWMSDIPIKDLPDIMHSPITDTLRFPAGAKMIYTDEVVDIE